MDFFLSWSNRLWGGLLFGLIGIFSLYAIRQFLYLPLRRESLKHEQEAKDLIIEKEKIRRKLHSQVLASISRINRWSTPLSQATPDDLGQQHKQILRITETSLALESQLRHLQWSLSSEVKTLYEVLRHIEKLGRDYLAGECGFNVEGIEATFKRIELDTGFADKLCEISQLAFANIWKHAQANATVLTISLVDKSLRIVIEDDGKGFDIEKSTEIGGISDMKCLALGIKGEFDIQSTQRTDAQRGKTKIVLQCVIQEKHQENN
jgi:signal transduction histidine kinase